eukprot:CAMPEP_0117436892 /NCGR_PEP_ID=MMETSP0759-20121206/1240_1 /TAXON_ID=63605 /ORGANISM="Percolomonas cosmopolitus, Strain WS" /LENGTH=192 /DNA_ID=CAMNT_0005228503 /DNA_START=147 /DNA_END=723 /DNA_ORIENTATION=+
MSPPSARHNAEESFTAKPLSASSAAAPQITNLPSDTTANAPASSPSSPVNEQPRNQSVYSKLRRQLFLQYRGPSLPPFKNGSLLGLHAIKKPATTSLLEMPDEILKYNSIPNVRDAIIAEKKLLPILAQPAAKPKTKGHISSETAVIRAGTGNVVVSIVKMISYFMTGSAAMFAESLHSIIDSVNQGLLYKG